MHEITQGVFLAEKNKERYNLECDYCVPKCPEMFLGVFLGCPVLHNCNPVVFPSFHEKQCSKEAGVLCSGLPP